MRFSAIVFASLMISLFQNCSKEISVEDISYVATSTTLSDQPDYPTTYEELKTNCLNAERLGKLKKKNVQVSFPNPQKACEWDANGNLSKTNELIRARVEQYQSLNLHDTSKVCTLNLKSLREDQFFYDDNLFLTLNDFVLASTSNFTQHLENKSGYYFYDWTKLRNQQAQNHDYNTVREKQYCAGADTGLGQCAFPATESYGAVALQFQDEVFQRIFSLSQTRDIKLGLITTGDDNTDTDCQHVDINFSIDVTYFD